MKLEINQGYKAEDVDRLYELEKKCFTRVFRWDREDLVKALKKDDIWVGVYEGKIIGYVLVDVDGDTGHIISLNVDPSCRRMGFASALMGAAEANYKKLKKLKLEVHVDNPAQILYFNLGYRVTGFRANYYSNHSNAISMTKVLKR